MQHNPQAYNTSRPFMVQLLILVLATVLTFLPVDANAKKSRRHRRHRSLRSQDYVANEGNRAAALAILSSEDDPSRKVAGLGKHGASFLTENDSDDGEDGSDSGDDQEENVDGAAAPWSSARTATVRQPSAVALQRLLKLKSGLLQDQQIADLNLPKITHSLQRIARKRCSKRTCNKELHHYLVQFSERITAEDSLNVTSLGATILRYMPEDAFIIEAEAVEAYTIRGSTTTVKAVIPYQASWKLSSELSGDVLAKMDRDERKLVQIRLFPTEEGKDASRKINEIGGVKVLTVSGRSLIAEIPARKVMDVAEVEAVEWIESRQPMTLMTSVSVDRETGVTKISNAMSTAINANANQRSPREPASLSGSETGAVGVNALKAWNRGLNGRGQIVAMADSGFDLGEGAPLPPDFTARVLDGQTFSSNGLIRKESVTHQGRDLLGHGTYLAELALGNGASLNGRASGVAPGAKLLPQKVWDEALRAVQPPTKLRDLFSSAYQAGARIHLDTWGSVGHAGQYSMDAQQVDEFVQMNPDMLIVFAAGDTGRAEARDANRSDVAREPGSVVSPATAKNALTVGAATQLGDALAPYSSQGPTADGRTKPEIVAPASNLLGYKSRAMDPKVQSQWIWDSMGESFVWSGGSANAAAVTAGSAAVIRQYLVENRKIQRPSAALMKAVLMHGATDVLSKRQAHAVPNETEGFGRVNLDRGTDLSEALIVDDRAGVGAGEAHAYKIRINSKTKLSATLVYTDTPAALAASTSLVNDLDLVIVDRDGHEISLGDHLNNFENLVRELPAGNYQVLVRGYNVPQAPNGKQPYSLIVSVD